MGIALAEVIGVDEKKCVNCHRCIAVCPVKFCIDGSGDHVAINHDLCIGCGSCIAACTHHARYGIDDTEIFFRAVERREKLVAIVAPAAASSFPGELLRLNGYLASLGVSRIFDVSFGAELTVKSYVEHIAASDPKLVIAQPCPAIVTYVELYRPELLGHLAPAHSPMLHTIAMIREYYPELAGHKVVAISPCFAKRREFDETGLGDYNVTFAALKRRLAERQISLSRFPERPFDSPEAERAVLFPTPGGLMRTVERDAPSVAGRTRKIEGPATVYRYLDQLAGMTERELNPLVVDCLNCEIGCNGGPGTDSQAKPPDELEGYVEARRRSAQERYRRRVGAGPSKRLTRTIESRWKPELYVRRYEDRSEASALRRPDALQLQEIYRRMEKHSEADLYNCSSCGYNSCEMMATAIFNGLNRPENCHHYQMSVLEKEHAAIARLGKELHDVITDADALIDEIVAITERANEKSFDQYASIEESAQTVEQMIWSIKAVSSAAGEKQEVIRTLVDAAHDGQHDMQRTLRSIEEISSTVHGITDLIAVINDMADRTDLLSMNAAIEAAHAGAAGKGFAVVAAEIRKLAETSGQSSIQISRTLKEMLERISVSSAISRRTGALIAKFITDVRGVAESITGIAGAMSEMSAGSAQITGALTHLREISAEVKADYGMISESLVRMRSAMSSISTSSRRNLDQMGASDGDGRR